MSTSSQFQVLTEMSLHHYYNCCLPRMNKDRTKKNTSPLTHSLPLSTPAVPMTPLLSETNAWTHSSRPISNKSKKSSALSPFTGPGGCHSGLACIISWVESPMSASVLGFIAGKGYCEEVWVCSGTSTQACYVKADSRANALEGRAPVSSFKPNG